MKCRECGDSYREDSLYFDETNMTCGACMKTNERIRHAWDKALGYPEDHDPCALVRDAMTHIMSQSRFSCEMMGAPDNEIRRYARKMMRIADEYTESRISHED